MGRERKSNPSEVKTFLMYDGDVPEVLESLKKCDGIMLISKPCVEIWFIAHFKKTPETDLSISPIFKLKLILLPVFKIQKLNTKAGVLLQMFMQILWKTLLEL